MNINFIIKINTSESIKSRQEVPNGYEGTLGLRDFAIQNPEALSVPAIRQDTRNRATYRFPCSALAVPDLPVRSRHQQSDALPTNP